MVVLDASAAVDLVLGRPAAGAVARSIRGERLRMPAHFDVEAFAGVRRHVIRREISPERGSAAILRIATLEAERVAIAPLLPAAFARACEGFVDVELARA